MSPRHLQHSPQDLRAGMVSSWQTARLRAMTWAEQLPRDRALSDATVLAAWLSPAQRRTYAPSLRAVDDPDLFVTRLAEERRVILEEGGDEVADEVGSAADVENRSAQNLLMVTEKVLLVASLAGVVWLGGVGYEAVTGRSQVDIGLVAPLLAAVLGSLLAAGLLGALATRWRDRALLDWAVSREGQLGRGIPVRKRLQKLSAGPLIVMVAGPALLLGAAIIALFAGAATLLVDLILRSDASLTVPALVTLAGGAACFLVGVVLVRWRGRRMELAVRRASAVEWLAEREADVELDGE